MNVTEMIALFRDFAGRDRYRKFVRTLNRRSRKKGRLFFWQEELWGEFAANHPGAPMSKEAIMDAFRICDVHNCRLDAAPGNDPPLEIRDTPEYDHAFETLFPFAGGGDLVCAICRSERSRWISENLDVCRILRNKTTYAAFCDKLLEDIVDPARRESLRRDAKEWSKTRQTEIDAQMQPGDELWEWDGGGWHHFSGRAGIAIVREGKIIKKWCLVKS